MALFTPNDLMALLKEIGKELNYLVSVDYGYVDLENTATFSYLGDNDKLFLSVVVLYGGIYTKINIFDQNDNNIFSKSVRAANFDKNEYQDVINKVQEELKKNLAHVPKKKEENDLYKVVTVYSFELEKTINKMAKEGWELHSSMVSSFTCRRDESDFNIEADDCKLIFRRQK